MFRVTYEIITPESAGHGDAEERGFLLPGGWPVSVDEALTGENVNMSLKEALSLCYPQQDCGSWFAEVDGHEDYRTGARKTCALHPPANITASSYARLTRLLGL
jgi:hypothetical protein